VGRILVAVDLSESSALVTSRAVELARSMQFELIALHVYDPDVLMQTLADSGMALDQYIDVLQSDLLRLTASAGAVGLRIRAEVTEGHAVGATILKTADRIGADLIVMGTHGRTGVWRTILGSVAEDVLRHAVRPVLIVPLRSATVPAPAVSRASAS
jgi:nucleotide-binding universal stress UspA family protein